MSDYRGRFAPSPTGPLHIGSLVGAMASFLDARANQGIWLLRIEDLDPPREIKGAAESILDCLQQHGLVWDHPVLWQSSRHPAYQQALEQLLASGKAFYCDCSRQDLLATQGVYNGQCRNRYPHQPPTQAHAIRLKVPDCLIPCTDRLQGDCSQNLQCELGDFILKRKDGLFAYQLAVVVDDAFQDISHVVRGSDLLDSTARQVYAQQQLGLPTPSYLHIPVINNQHGQKLSKQTYAAPLANDRQCQNLLAALAYLGQPEPPADRRTQNTDILSWSIANWNPAAIPPQLAITEANGIPE